MPLRLMQSHQEEFLRKVLLEKYANLVKIYYGFEMITFNQNEYECNVVAEQVKLNKNNNNEQLEEEELEIIKRKKLTVTSKYLIACEGPSGLISKKLKIKFEGLINIAQAQSILFHAPGINLI